MFLVRDWDEPSPRKFGAVWNTVAGTASTSDYTSRSDTNHTWGDGNEARANRVKETFRTTADNLVEGDETFTVKFVKPTGVVDPDDPDKDNKCEITIEDDDPNITDIDVISAPARDDGAYGVGEVIEIQATFNISVDVNGNPRLGM